MTDDNELPPKYPEFFTQWSGNNVDHNVITLDGHGTFHDMGMLAMSVRSQGTDVIVSGHFGEAPVKRIPRVNVISLKAHTVGVTILPYMEPDDNVLSKIIFKPDDEIKSAVTEQPILSSLDLV